MMEKKNRLIVVLGMHRSGTSAITRGLKVMGVELGDKLIPAIEEINAKGFWEDVDINILNDQMLKAIGSDWHHLTPISSIDIEFLKDNGYFLRAVDLLKQKVSDTPLFGFKDPRVTKLLAFWNQVFDYCQLDVFYVLAVRHPLSVAKSLEKRDGFDREKSYLLWLGHVITSLIESMFSKHVLVDYDLLMQSPDYQLNRVAKEFDLEINVDELQRYKSEFLTQDLRHTVYNLDELLLDDTCPTQVKEIYSFMLDVASEKIPLNDIDVQKSIERWACEFERLKSSLILLDRLFVQITGLNDKITERDTQIAERDTQIAERDTQIVYANQVIEHIGREQQDLKQDLEKLIQERSHLNQVIAQHNVQEAQLEEFRVQLTAVYKSTSWRLTSPLRWLGRKAHRGISNVKYSQVNKKNTQEQVAIANVSTEQQDDSKFRILLVSHFCPSRGHAGGLRILDIYALIRTQYPDVQIDLLTFHRPSVDWSLDDVYRIFHHVYLSPVENLSPEILYELRGSSLYYDVVDLQFHQLGHQINAFRSIGKKIIFTPMESLARCLALDLRANLKFNSAFSLGKTINSFKVAAEEIDFALKVDRVVCVSKSDASFLSLICRTKNITFLETAVSTLEFAEIIDNPNSVLNPELKENIIVYVAYFGSETNVMALKWYLDYVHSLISQHVSDYKLQVVGRGDLSVFENYKSNSIEFVGEVDSLIPVVNNAKVGIAPALNGSGLRGKINQYAIFGVPSVVSAISAKGLIYQDGVDICISDKPEDFANHCINLLKDNNLNKKMGQLAREKAFTHYSWESKIRDIQNIYGLELL